MSLTIQKTSTAKFKIVSLLCHFTPTVHYQLSAQTSNPVHVCVGHICSKPEAITDTKSAAVKQLKPTLFLVITPARQAIIKS